MMGAATYGFLSVLPPFIAIGLALLTRQVFLSLLIGIWVGFVILAEGNLFTGSLGTLDGFSFVFSDAGNTRIIMFTFIVGALIGLIQYSGGVQGFTDYLLKRLEAKAHSAASKGQRKRVELLALLTGLILFIESNISILTVGTLYRPVFDKLSIPREKLAYITDSSSAPSCILFPFNAWGAFIAGLLLEKDIVHPFGLVLATIALNVYPWLVIFILLFVIISGRDVGEMKLAEQRARETGKLLRDGARPMMVGEISGQAMKAGLTAKARHMLIPIGTMVCLMPIFLILTGWPDGQGDIFKALQSGSGSKSVLYATSFACAAAMVIYKIFEKIGVREMFELSIKSMSGMFPLALLMVFAYTLGHVCRELGTGDYVADSVSGIVPPALVPAMLFLSACLIAFATGTSWGTFAIMMAIAVPLAQNLDLNITLCVAAALGGGIFGDHCSPTSDTSIITSMATASDHIDHIRTQLPYALIGGAVSVIIYIILGMFLS